MHNFKQKLYLLILAILLASPASARDIYVKLAQDAAYSLTSDGDMTLTDSAGRQAGLGNSVSLRVNGDKVSATRVTLKSVTIGPVAFTMPVRLVSTGFLGFNGNKYRGSFLITQAGGLLNVLDIEQYLRGVLPAEVGASWPMEALRAQAIISRTYALKRSLTRTERGYDVVDTVADQVYKGAGVETAQTDQAVASTANEVLAYKKELVLTPFHADSGGHTASNEDVWGSPLPYLTGVPEPVPYTSPVSSWSAKVPRSTIENVVARLSGKKIAPITAIRVSKVDKGGRAVNITFTGSKGASVTLKASAFRTAIGANVLKSTLLWPNASGTAKPPVASDLGKKTQAARQGNALTSEEERELAQMTAEGVFTSSELIDMLSDPKKKLRYYQIGLERGDAFRKKRPSAQTPQAGKQPFNQAGFSIAKSGNDFIFYGRGWGHGVGLSQWGALALAQNGWTAEMILTHYYQGTTVMNYR